MKKLLFILSLAFFFAGCVTTGEVVKPLWTDKELSDAAKKDAVRYNFFGEEIGEEILVIIPDEILILREKFKPGTPLGATNTGFTVQTGKKLSSGIIAASDHYYGRVVAQDFIPAPNQYDCIIRVSNKSTRISTDRLKSNNSKDDSHLGYNASGVTVTYQINIIVETLSGKDYSEIRSENLVATRRVGTNGSIYQNETAVTKMIDLAVGDAILQFGELLRKGFAEKELIK